MRTARLSWLTWTVAVAVLLAFVLRQVVSRDDGTQSDFGWPIPFLSGTIVDKVEYMMAEVWRSPFMLTNYRVSIVGIGVDITTCIILVGSCAYVTQYIISRTGFRLSIALLIGLMVFASFEAINTWRPWVERGDTTPLEIATIVIVGKYSSRIIGVAIAVSCFVIPHLLFKLLTYMVSHRRASTPPSPS